MSSIPTLLAIQNIPVRHYTTKYLFHVRNDHINGTICPGRTAYLTDMPTDYVIQYRRRRRSAGNRALERKIETFFDIPERDRILSLSRATLPLCGISRRVVEGDIVHMGAVRMPRLWHILDIISATWMTIREARRFDTLLFTNFYPATAIPALVMKLLFRKTIVIDYQDGYENRRGWLGSRVAERLVSSRLDGAVLIHEGMAHRLRRGVKYVVKNTTKDVDYCRGIVETQSLPAIVRFLFAGSWDSIRGVDLLDDFSDALTERGIDHRILVTGFAGETGFESYAFRSSKITRLGFVRDDELARLMRESHAGLVFQKPDHPFSTASYPSKVDLYASARLPILVLE